VAAVQIASQSKLKKKTSHELWRGLLAPLTEQLSIKINVTEEYLKSGTCEINPGQRLLILISTVLQSI
jgi:hypothetical protein